MKRRRLLQALAGIPAGTLLAQQPGKNQAAPGVPLNSAQGVQPPASADNELPKLQASVPDAAATSMPRFFNGAQFAALQKVSDLIMPSVNGAPGAIAAEAPEFLDFLVGDSPAARQRIYREGLDGLIAQSQKQFKKAFSDLDATQAESLLAPLRQPWTFDLPTDPVAQFLRTAKADIRTATINSRAYGAGRRFAGTGQYWYPLD